MSHRVALYAGSFDPYTNGHHDIVRKAAALFDGDPATFFDGQSRIYQNAGFRIGEGCLRLDFVSEVDADTVEIEFFAADEETRELKPALIPGAAIQPRTPPKQSASGTAAISRESRRTPRACASDVGALSGGRMAPLGHPCSHSRQVMQVLAVTEGVFHETKEKSLSKTP